MSFTGSILNNDGSRLAVLDYQRSKRDVEQLADIAGIVSPYETPLLNAIGDPVNFISPDESELFESKVEVDLPVNSVLSIGDELYYMKQEHLRELLRDLEAYTVKKLQKTRYAKNFYGELTEEKLNAILDSADSGDIIAVNGYHKREINKFNQEGLKTLYAYKLCYRVVCCRWIPSNTVLVLDNDKIEVQPIKPFTYYPLFENSGVIKGNYGVIIRLEDSK